MKKVLEVLAGAALVAALGIVGAVERGADVALMWWTLPCVIVMAIAAGFADSENTKKFLREGVKQRD